MISRVSLGEKLKTGDQFLFAEDEKIITSSDFYESQEELSDESFFGEFISEEKQGNLYKVTFRSPDLTKVFEENGANVFINDYDEGNIEDLELNTEAEIKSQVVNSEVFQDFLYAKYLDVAQNEPYVLNKGSFMDYVDNLKVTLRFGIKWPGWTIEFGINVSVPLKNCTITFMINYYRLSKYSVSASFELRKVAGVPYWADISFDMVEDASSAFTVTFIIGAKLPSSTGDKKKDYGNLSDYVKKEVNDLKAADQKYQSIKDMGGDAVSFNGNKLTIDTGKGRWPILYIFDFYVGFSFEINLSAEAVFNYNYASHTVTHIIRI